MNNPTQDRSWILGIRRRLAGAALALAVVLLPAVVATRSAQAQPYPGVLYAFTGGADGGFPVAGLARDERGNLYGVTSNGGTYGQGTVFEVGGGGKTVLYSFTGGADGQSPGAGLTWVQGNLYGTTVSGGAYGAGTVFKLDESGMEAVLHSFTGGGDGASPDGVLVLDAQGNVYGTASGAGAYGQGTVFKVDATGNETTLYSFTGTGGDGSSPHAGLVLDAEGNLYGTTYGGGAFGQGTVFKVDATGNETVLYSFGAAPGDGANPTPGLARDPRGNLYGTTVYGGNDWNNGTVFKLDTTGKETVLHNFVGAPVEGANPYAGVVRDRQGNLYGTTFYGGDVSCYMNGAFPGCGTVFAVDPTGNERMLYSFTGYGDGANPEAGLALDPQGNLYGTAPIGGNYGGPQGAPCWPFGCGTVFWLAMAPTTTTVSSSLNPANYWDWLTFTATVTSSAGTPPDGGTVTFMQGGTVLATSPLYGGLASFHSWTLPAGTNLLRAVYSGFLNFEGSTSKVLKQVVYQDTTTTTLTSQNPSGVGQSVGFSAVVTPAILGDTNAGSMTFYDGTKKLKTLRLHGNWAGFVTSKLTLGTHNITATYSGNRDYTGSSASLIQTVDQASTTTTLVSSLNPSNYKQAVTFTATVVPQFSGTVKGTVTFYDGTTELRAVSLSRGEAKYKTSKLTAGTHSITATYNGNIDYTGSSASLTQTVN